MARKVYLKPKDIGLRSDLQSEIDNLVRLEEVDCNPEGSVRDGDDGEEDVGCSGEPIDLLERDHCGQQPCLLAVLHLLAMTLACIDYISGAGIGGSLTQGGGTAAADNKMKSAKEEVTELVGVASFAARINILLALKHDLKFVRWNGVTAADDYHDEELSLNCRMPEFRLGMEILKCTGW